MWIGFDFAVVNMDKVVGVEFDYNHTDKIYKVFAVGESGAKVELTHMESEKELDSFMDDLKKLLGATKSL